MHFKTVLVGGLISFHRERVIMELTVINLLYNGCGAGFSVFLDTVDGLVVDRLIVLVSGESVVMVERMVVDVCISDLAVRFSVTDSFSN